MDEIIQIKCPFCGSVLSVKTQPGIESKNVGCPVCRHKYPFTHFKCLSGSSPGDEPPKETLELGRLTVDGSGISYRLMPGRNVVGRKAAKSEAGIQIYTADSRAMSREHIVIDVKNVPGKGFVHTLSLYKEKVNPTFIGSEPLVYGDRIVLTHGDVIRLPDTTLKFELPDEEATEI